MLAGGQDAGLVGGVLGEPVGGRLFAVVGEGPAMDARLVRRTGEQEWLAESLFETVLPPLHGAARHERFAF